MSAAAKAPRLDEYVVRDPRMHHGRPTLRGSRIEVADVVRYHQGLGYSAERIARALPTLTLAQVHAALAYYYEHAAEVDRELRDADAYVAREMRKAARRPRGARTAR